MVTVRGNTATPLGESHVEKVVYKLESIDLVVFVVLTTKLA